MKQLYTSLFTLVILFSFSLANAQTFWDGPKITFTKDANAGESLSTGAFVIRGKTNYVPVDALRIGIGVKDGQVRLIGQYSEFRTL